MNKTLFLLLSCITAQGSINAMELRDFAMFEVKLLLRGGTDPNLKDRYGLTPLHKVACNGDEAVARLLLEMGANPNLQNDFDETPLHEAAYSCHKAIVRLLLERGADANQKDRRGRTPLFFALDKRHEAIAKILRAWPSLVQGSRAGRLAFCMAMQPRVGASSPASMLSHYVFQEICSHLKPSALIDDQEAVVGYEQPRWCIIS